jgi:hypothetical protein
MKKYISISRFKKFNYTTVILVLNVCTITNAQYNPAYTAPYATTPYIQPYNPSPPANPFAQTGYSNDGTLFMGGQRIGNPHQILHDAQIPSYMTITASRYTYTNPTDPVNPNYGQGTLTQMERATVAGTDTSVLLNRLYLTPSNPYPVVPTGTHNNFQTYANALTAAQTTGYRLITADDGKAYVVKTLEPATTQTKSILLSELPNTVQFKAAADTQGGAVGIRVTQSGEAAAHATYQNSIRPYDFNWLPNFGTIQNNTTNYIGENQYAANFNNTENVHKVNHWAQNYQNNQFAQFDRLNRANQTNYSNFANAALATSHAGFNANYPTDTIKNVALGDALPVLLNKPVLQADAINDYDAYKPWTRNNSSIFNTPVFVRPADITADFPQNDTSKNSSQGQNITDIQTIAQTRANNLDLSNINPNNLFGYGYDLFKYGSNTNPNKDLENDFLRRLQSGQLTSGTYDYTEATRIAQERFRIAYATSILTQNNASTAYYNNDEIFNPIEIINTNTNNTQSGATSNTSTSNQRSDNPAKGKDEGTYLGESPYGVRIFAGIPGKGTFYNPVDNIIIIDPKTDFQGGYNAYLAHEDMHARQHSEGRLVILPNAGETNSDFITRYIDARNRIEAEASFAQGLVNSYGMNVKLVEVLDAYLKGYISAEVAMGAFANIIPDLRPSTNESMTYREYHRLGALSILDPQSHHAIMEIHRDNEENPPGNGPTDDEIRKTTADVGDFDG